MDALVHLHIVLGRLLDTIGNCTEAMVQAVDQDILTVLISECDDLSIPCTHLVDFIEAVLPSGSETLFERPVEDFINPLVRSAVLSAYRKRETLAAMLSDPERGIK